MVTGNYNMMLHNLPLQKLFKSNQTKFIMNFKFETFKAHL